MSGSHLKLATELRRQADRLSYAAETLPDREPCRDVSGERDRLRGAAANADERATVAEMGLRRVPRWR